MDFSESVRVPLKYNFSGGIEAAVRPDPFPNSAVKRGVADGSACIACARVGCRRFLFWTHHGGSGFLEIRIVR